MRALGILCLLLIFGGLARAAELRIAAASDLKFALDEIIKAFEGAEIKVTYGSSGNFFAQLQNRAPFDLYFSADVSYPRKLAEAGLALDTNVFIYGIGRIVVWKPGADKPNLNTLSVAKKIAIANPKHAPYGAAAVAALKSLKLYDAVEPKLVFGENVSQAAQFAQSGAADAGIIALSLALAPQMRAAGKYWEIPLEAYPKMEQGGIILNWTKEPATAEAFCDLVRSARGREILKRYGFNER